jgi:two-component system, NtrC family, sensor kinase
VDQLLKFSRKTLPKFETINLNEVIEGVLPLLSYHKLPASAINIVKDLNADIPPINGDLNQLQEVFLNLFINAYQSMQNGGTLTVKTDQVHGKQVEIKITDTGCGIPQDNLKNIFMPFFSTKKEGTGLGLPICYNIIKNHNGTVDVESQLNKGTSFIVKLPFA